MNQFDKVTISGSTVIQWESGATAQLVREGNEIKILFEYKPTEYKKEYILKETLGKKMIAGELKEKRGMCLK